MTSVFDVSLSGLRAFARKLEASAHNVANVSTDGFKRLEVTAADQPDGGVRTTVEEVAAPGLEVVAPETGEVKELSNVDLSDEMINMIIAQRGFEANLQVIRAENEMVGRLIDTVV